MTQGKKITPQPMIMNELPLDTPLNPEFNFVEEGLFQDFRNTGIPDEIQTIKESE